MFALIFENKVVEISQKKFPVAESMQWVECNESVQTGWHYVNQTFKKTLESETEILIRCKKEKIQKIKAIRDAKNIEPITDTSAEIINEDSGEAIGLNTFFVFHTSRHPTNPAADPSAILTGIIMLNHAVPYSTKDISGAKVTVEITPAIARSLAAHLALRNNNNYKLANAIVNAINAATTEEEVNAITWNVDYL